MLLSGSFSSLGSLGGSFGAASAKRTSPLMVGRRVEYLRLNTASASGSARPENSKSGMKGKSKTRQRDRDMWLMDSDSEDGPLYGQSPMGGGSMTASYIRSSLFPGVAANGPAMLKPRNEAQARYLKLLENCEDGSAPIVIGTGSSGSGKTAFAVHVAARKLVAGEIGKIILTRPTVSVDEELGFLPGNVEEKMDPWMRPIYDVLYLYFSPGKVQALMAKQIIEICPLAFLRGRTFESSFIIADEFQNSTVSQMLALLTRIGNDSKMVITGDPMQHDRGFEVNGLLDLIQRVRRTPEAGLASDIQIVEFKPEDVQRHPVIKKILRIYG